MRWQYWAMVSICGAVLGWSGRGIYEHWQNRRRMARAIAFLHRVMGNMQEHEQPADEREINELRRMMGEEGK